MMIFSFLKNRVILSVSICFFCLSAISQDLEPRAYANVPKGINVLAVGYGLNTGSVLTDPVLPIKDFKLTTQIFSVNYIRSFGFANKLARLQVNLPMADMHGRLQLNGEEVTGSRSGFADMRVRLGVNLTGSPALGKKEFIQYQQNTIIGASLVTSIPTGRYYNEKQINIGSNRWAFKPEIGVSRRFFSCLYTETYIGTWFYTKNTAYFPDKELKQKPTVTLQIHASYYFKNQMWVGFNGNWYKVGETSINDVPSTNVLDERRIGLTFSAPLTKTQSVRLQYHTGISSNIGLNYDSLTVAYQYIFF